MTKIIPRGDVRWGFPLLAPNHIEPSQYLYQITLDHEIAPGMLFHDCLVEMATAHLKHPNGARFSCYGSWIGLGLVWLYYPLQSADDVSNLLPNEQCLMDTKGEIEGKKIYADFISTLSSQDKKVLEYLPDFSNIKIQAADTPFEYVYYIIAQLDNTVVKELSFKNAVKSITAAHNEHKNGLQWVTYQELGTSNVHLFIPMRKLGCMDKWPQLATVLDGKNKSEIYQIRQTLYSGIKAHHNYLMTFVPSCDNSGCEVIE